MSIIIYLFEFQPPMCSLSPKLLNFKKEIAVLGIPVAEIISGKIFINFCVICLCNIMYVNLEQLYLKDMLAFVVYLK
jgi:hypothetical protein